MEFSLSGLQIVAGKGIASFPMQRGSFSYKEKTLWQDVYSVLVQGEGEEEGLLVDSFSNVAGEISLVKEEGESCTLYRLKISFNDEAIDRMEVTFPAGEGEHFYGGGETFSHFDLKGQKVRVWVAEHQNAKRIAKKILAEKILGPKPNKIMPLDHYESYYVQPTFITSEKQFFHSLSTLYGELDFTEKGRVTYRTHVEKGRPAEILLGEAKDFGKLSAALSLVTGRPEKLPEWIYEGSILAVQRGTQEIDRVLAKAKENGVSICGIWSQDWCGCRRTGFGYQVMWNWQKDEEMYADLKEKIAAWNKEGVHFLGYINPFLALEKPLYKEASEKGYTVKAPDGSDYQVTITTFPAAMIDLTNPEAREWEKKVIKENMLALGMSGWMADFGEYLPVDAVLFSGEDAAKKHNEWPMLWAKLSREAIEEYCEENGKDPREIFFFTRAGFTGTAQSGSVMWNGDQHVDWSKDDGLASTIPATLSLACSGNLMAHSDMGGYTTIMQMTRSRELLMRWEEMSAFTPIMRTHEGNQPTRNVQAYDDEELLAHLKKCTELHKALGPYLKKCMEEASGEGLPMMRPLFYHYEEEKAFTEKFEYLLGRDILVAPVIDQGADKREVYLPEDQWIHLPTGLYYEGCTIKVPASLGQIPVFIRKASGLYDQLKNVMRQM